MKIACEKYSQLGKRFDKSLAKFRREVGYTPNLSDEAHLLFLLEWLNSWGCRQFKIEDHKHAVQSIQRWHQECKHLLPGEDRDLTELNEKQLKEVAGAYGHLSEAVVSYKNGQRGNPVTVHCGPTGAAKVLFALRPKALPPWDAAIREYFGYGKSEASYSKYLQRLER